MVSPAVSALRVPGARLDYAAGSAPALDRQPPAALVGGDDTTVSEPRIVPCDGHFIIEFRTKLKGVLPVHIDDLEAAKRLLAAGPWHPYPNRPGKERYLRRSIRIGKEVATEYAYNFLFHEPGAENCTKLKPRDGNYLNLRSANFQKPTPRSQEEVMRYMALLGPMWEEMTKKAKLALFDQLKSDDAIGATLDQVMESLEEPGKVSFANDEKFVAWVWTILEAQIKRRQWKCGDVVLDDGERQWRGLKSVEELKSVEDWIENGLPEHNDE